MKLLLYFMITFFPTFDSCILCMYFQKGNSGAIPFIDVLSNKGPYLIVTYIKPLVLALLKEDDFVEVQAKVIPNIKLHKLKPVYEAIEIIKIVSKFLLREV